MHKALLTYHLRQLRQSPATGVFLTCGWVAGILLIFISGQLIATNRAELTALFGYMPWILAVLIPTLAMPAASEGRRGVTERLATLPFSPVQRLTSRFIVLWALLGVWILGFWPLVATLYYLGRPDLGPIATGLFGSWLLSAPLLALSLVICLRAKSGVGGLLGAMSACLILVLIGTTTVTSWFAAVPGFGWLPSTANITLLGAYHLFTVGLFNIAALLLLLGLTAFVLGLSLKRDGLILTVSGTVLLLISFIPAIGWVQLDATAESLHTPSELTITALRQLPQPVTFTLYVSQNNPDVPPAVHQSAQSLKNMLLRLRSVAASNVNVKLSNADSSVGAAIAALQAGATEQSLPTGTTYFAALTADVNGHKATMPIIDPTRQPVQEYDVMALLAKASNQTPPHITILSANPSANAGWQAALEKTFALTPIPQTLGVSELPNATDVLLLPDDAALPSQTLAAVRTYLNGGGNVILFAAPFSRTNPAGTSLPNETRLSTLLPEWGVTLVPETIIADPTQATLAQQAGAGASNYPYWLQLNRSNLDTTLPFTAGITNLFVPEPGSLSLQADSSMTLVPVITTSAAARAVSLSTFQNTPPELAATTLPTQTGKHVLATMISGPFSESASRSGNLLVVADMDWLTPTALAQSPDNLALLVNTLHYMSGQGMLTALRAKGASPRTLTRIEAMANRLAQQTARTEQKIATRLYEVTQSLNNNPAQSADSLAAAQEEEFTLRQQLRDIRQQTRHRLQMLENALLLLNLAFMPTVIGVLFLLQRRRQRLKATSTL